MTEETSIPKLVVLQVRITNQQNDKLKTIREVDGLSIQEHVRRAIDIYTARITPKQAVAGGVAAQDTPKVVRK